MFCSFNGVPAEERLHWRSFLVKLGVDNLRGVKNEELLVANHKYVRMFIVFFQFSCEFYPLVDSIFCGCLLGVEMLNAKNDVDFDLRC